MELSCRFGKVWLIYHNHSTSFLTSVAFSCVFPLFEDEVSYGFLLFEDEYSYVFPLFEEHASKFTPHKFGIRFWYFKWQVSLQSIKQGNKKK